MIESLETRRLLAATLTVNGSVLTLNGNKADDTLVVRENMGAVHVEYTDFGGNFVATDVGGITAININGGGGEDSIFYTGNTIGANIHGDNQQINNGNGKLKGGTGGGSGGGNGGGPAGDDFISVSDDGTGTSTVNGDKGDDNITLLHGNNTVILGSDGNDNIQINTAAAGGSSTVDAGKGNDFITIYDGTNTVNGGAGNDTVLMDVPPGPGDLSGGGNVNVALQTLISIEHVETF